MMTSVLFSLLASLGMGSAAVTDSAPSAQPAPVVAESIAIIRSVGPEGRGNAAATSAWKSLAAVDVNQLPRVLGGFDGADPLAINWLRAAVEVLVQRSAKAGHRLPLTALGEFLFEANHHPEARQLAFELIQREQPSVAEALLPGLLQDPSRGLRRQAVDRVIRQAAEAGRGDRLAEAVVQYRQALAAARDVDQIQSITQALRDLGESVDLVRRFGWLTEWRVIGPFDNRDGRGFDRVYPPEREIDLTANYEGVGGPVAWTTTTAKNEFGLVDLNRVYGMLKGAAGYCFTEFETDQARPVELRLGCKNGWKVWLNGELLFGRDEYHRNMEIDQYRLKAQLREGRNTILVKLCQNEQKEEWTVEWEFQLRITDALGTAVHFGRRAEIHSP